MTEKTTAAPAIITQRFSQCCVSTQQAVLCHLQQPVVAGGAYSSLPVAEWCRLLQLIDPIIGATGDTRTPRYWVLEGAAVLRLLAGHYLDIH